MSTRTVRLDNEAEKALKEIQQTTGMSVSAALKRGLLVLRDDMAKEVSTTPYDIYKLLDLGPGGYAIGSSKATRRTLRDAIRKKLGR